MTISKVFTFRAHIARSWPHPVLKGVHEHVWLVRAKDLPHNLPTGGNARPEIGTTLSRRTYKAVKQSLLQEDTIPGSFDQMNQGITILANSVKLVEHEKNVFQVSIPNEKGVINGNHTKALLNKHGAVAPDEQFVKVFVRTGYDQHPGLASDVARGQNSSVAVKAESIHKLEGVFKPIMAVVAGQWWANKVIYGESDKGIIDVRDLICAMEALNVIDYRNHSGTHPHHAYEKWATAELKYALDYHAHEDKSARKYAALEPLLLDALKLFDTIRHDFQAMYNKHVAPGAGHLKIMEKAKDGKLLDFPFSGHDPDDFRLHKGPTYPLFAAFRNCVVYDEGSHQASWIGGFPAVLALWQKVGPMMLKELANASKDIGYQPDQQGKSRSHWTNMHKTVEIHLLRMLVAKAA